VELRDAAGKTPPRRLRSYWLCIFADDSGKRIFDPTISTRSRFAGRMVYLGRNCITQRTVE